MEPTASCCRLNSSRERRLAGSRVRQGSGYARKEGKETGIASVNSLALLIRKENKKSIVEGGNNFNGIPYDQNDIYEYMQRFEIAATKGILYSNTYKINLVLALLQV